MNAAQELNAVLARDLPAAWRCLSPLGRAAAFPRGIPFQAAEARGARINATIGQLTDGHGNPMPLDALEAGVLDLDPKALFLYAPVEGPLPLRQAWGAREHRLAGHPDVAVSTPFVTHGLTHSLSLLSDLFVDPATDLVVPQPAWENYDLIFRMHARGTSMGFPFFRDGRFNLEGLADALSSVRTKALLVLNFPNNPTGYHPSPDEAAAIVDVVTSHPGPLVVATDDAYQGWVYEEGRHPRSLFWDLCEKADLDRLLPVKVDGATKELVFFSSRVGFLTHPAPGEAEEALRSKLKFLVRGTVGSASGPALAMAHHALQSDSLESSFAARRDAMAVRWRTLRDAMDTLPNDRVVVHPFQGAYFALLSLTGGQRAEDIREHLLAEHSVGVVAFPEANALRVAYCSIRADQLEELVDSLRTVLH